MRLILTHDDGTEIRTYSEVEEFFKSHEAKQDLIYYIQNAIKAEQARLET